MNKASLIKAQADFETSPYITELKLARNVAFIMHFNDKVNALQTLLKEQKAMPNLNLTKIQQIMNGLDEVNSLVKTVVSKEMVNEDSVHDA
jgi:hypothetical protein